MTDAAHDPPVIAEEPILPPWSNIIPRDGDPEIAWIDGLLEHARPIPRVAWAIRNLITRFEICHFKIERHFERILDAIGSMRLDLDPADIGQAHPRWGEQAWQSDRTGRSRIGQEYIWILQLWLADACYPKNDPRGIARDRFAAIYAALGQRDAQKTRLVAALIGRLLLRDDRQPLTGDLEGFWEQTERMDICHYAFPRNLDRMIQAIGALEPVPTSEFEGCGSCGAAQHECARQWIHDLVAWLHAQPGRLSQRLGNRTPVKQWLVASLAKTLKEHAALPDDIVPPSTNGGTQAEPSV